jgi:sulfotransferase family protein
VAALPNLLVIGAMKAGTTSLHRYLDQHPEVQMSEWKELNFFVKREDTQDGNWHRGLDWYRGWFDESAAVRGESSHHYTSWPFFGGVPERAVEVVPDARLVYLVRDPVERFLSHHMERRKVGIERNSLDEVVEWTLQNPDNGLVARSRYFMQLERWLARYPEESLLVVALEDLQGGFGQTMARIFEFLGVDPSFVPPDAANANPHTDQREARSGGHLLDVARQRAEKSVNLGRARRVLPAPARRAARAAWMRVATRPMERPRLSPEHEAGLADLFRDDAARLRELTGEAYPSWSV